MPVTPSFQDLLNQFSDEVFVGRGEQLRLLEQALTASRPPFLILAISGQGGVGKTTLLEQFRRIADDHGARSALVNDDQVTVPAALSTQAKQLAQAGSPLKSFEDRYKKYRELNDQVEADPKAPTGLADLALQSATRIGLRSLKRVPVAGDVADVLLSPETETAIAEQTSAFARYVVQKFSNKDERSLLLDTDAELSRQFLTDLNPHAAERRLILLFDTFEKTAPALERWLLDLLSGHFGSFPGNVLFVIAGRYPLGQAWTRFRKAIRQVELHAFDETEARDYLQHSGITDEQTIQQMLELSNRLPVLLALLVSAPSRLPQDVSGDAVERFLAGTSPQQREIALVASVPRFFNQDILRVLVGAETDAEAFDWLSDSAFVRPGARGWAYHDVVRSLMLRFLRQRSGQRAVEIHKTLAQQYQAQATRLGLAEDRRYIHEAWRSYQLEYLYHRLSQNPPQNMEEAAQLFFTGFMALTRKYFYESDLPDAAEKAFADLLRGCADVLEQVGKENAEPALGEWAGRYRRLTALISEEAGQPTPVDLALVRSLGSVDGLSDHERSIALFVSVFLGIAYNIPSDRLVDINAAIRLSPQVAVYYLIRAALQMDAGNTDAARADLDQAVALQPDAAVFYEQRGSLLSGLGDYAAAIADFSKAIALQPKEAGAYAGRGKAYRLSQNRRAAVADYSEAITRAPKEGDNYFWRGLTYRELENYPAALDDLTQAIALQPQEGETYVSRGRTYRALKNYPAALDDFSAAIALAPTNANYYHWRAHAYRDLGNYPAALADFSKAVALQPDDANNYDWRRDTYREMLADPSTLGSFTAPGSPAPTDDWLFFRRGLAFFAQGEPARHAADVAEAVALAEARWLADPANWHNALNLALYHLAAGKPDEARAGYERAAALCTDPGAIAEGLAGLEDFAVVCPDSALAKEMIGLLSDARSRLQSAGNSPPPGPAAA